jgi:hypothetical protein
LEDDTLKDRIYYTSLLIVRGGGIHPLFVIRTRAEGLYIAVVQSNIAYKIHPKNQFRVPLSQIVVSSSMLGSPIPGVHRLVFWDLAGFFDDWLYQNLRVGMDEKWDRISRR